MRNARGPEHDDAYFEQPSHVLGSNRKRAQRLHQACRLVDQCTHVCVEKCPLTTRHRVRSTAAGAAAGRREDGKPQSSQRGDARVQEGEKHSAVQGKLMKRCAEMFSTRRLTAVRKRRHCEASDEDKTERETFSEQLSARANGEPKIHHKPTQQNKSTKTSLDDEARKLRTQEHGQQQTEKSIAMQAVKSIASRRQRGTSPTPGGEEQSQHQAEKEQSMYEDQEQRVVDFNQRREKNKETSEKSSMMSA